MEKDELITLGSWPYTAGGEKRPIEWQVLHVSDDSALLLSRYALDAQPKFRKSENAEEEHEEAKPGVFSISPEQRRLMGLPYEESWLYHWLNNEFLQGAFTEKERSFLLEAKDSTHAGKGNLGRVFALSVEDINNAEMFPSDLSTNCTATPYAKSKYEDDIERNRQEEADRPYAECASWWLRNEGLVVWGGGAHAKGIVCMRLLFTEPLAVRPAILIDLKAYEKATRGSFLDRLFGKKAEPKHINEKVTFHPIRSAEIKRDEKLSGRVLLLEEAAAGHGAKILFVPEGINQQSVELVSKPGISSKEVETLMNLFALACTGLAGMQMTLGSLYWAGNVVPQSYEESVRWDRYAANQGDTNAMLDLAECYHKGLGGLPQNDQKAFQLIRSAAEKGNAHGMENLAVCYQCGIGVDADPEKAMEWAEKAEEAKKNQK